MRSLQHGQAHGQARCSRLRRRAAARSGQNAGHGAATPPPPPHHPPPHPTATTTHTQYSSRRSAPPGGAARAAHLCRLRSSAAARSAFRRSWSTGATAPVLITMTCSFSAVKSLPARDACRWQARGSKGHGRVRRDEACPARTRSWISQPIPASWWCRTACHAAAGAPHSLSNGCDVHSPHGS